MTERTHVQRPRAAAAEQAGGDVTPPVLEYGRPDVPRPVPGWVLAVNVTALALSVVLGLAVLCSVRTYGVFAFLGVQAVICLGHFCLVLPLTAWQIRRSRPSRPHRYYALALAPLATFAATVAATRLLAP